MTTSATGGYLSPLAFAVNDNALADIIQEFIVGVTLLDGEYVRPAWQSNPYIIPTNGTDWCAFSLGNFVAGQAYQVQAASGNDTNVKMEQCENFDVSCSFYGANCQRYAAVVRDGLQIAQNREALWLQGISITGGVQIVHVPELINDVWHDRCDIVIAMGRKVNADYAVLHFVGAAGTINTDAPETVTEWTAGAKYSSTRVFNYVFSEVFA
jgi:hypothetical protein